MSNINLIIDSIEVSVPEGTTILNAAKKIGIKIPTLCYLEDQDIKANCRICAVELRGKNKIYTACSTPVWEGMDIVTNTKRVREIRKTVLELILANHPQDCLSCIRNGNCELQKLAVEYNIRKISFDRNDIKLPIDNRNASIVRDPNKCIKCGRCVEMCQKTQNVKILNFAHRSIEYSVTTPFDKPLDETGCLYCGQCINVCPVGAIYEKEDIDRVWDAIDDSKKHVIVQTAPAVRVSLGEEFGLDGGSIVTGKMAAALRRLGFDGVFDTNFAADLTIMEEASELIHRVQNNGVFPMMTSCSPGWVNFVEKHYPDMIPNLSTCKSPQQMFGAIAKTYYAEKINKKPEEIFVVSVMPCTAKKSEAKREEFMRNGVYDVDAVITTRELARMLKEGGIDFNTIKEENYDSPLGESTGAGTIFGATGGVMEAALRTAYKFITDEELEEIDFCEVRGMEGIKESEVTIGGLSLKVAVIHGIKNARTLVEKVKSGECDYQFIEVMCCPGGCIGGGGQPIASIEVRDKRRKALYVEDKNKVLRKSHENPEIQKLYSDYLEKPLSHKSHELLHTIYRNKVK